MCVLVCIAMFDMHQCMLILPRAVISVDQCDIGVVKAVKFLVVKIEASFMFAKHVFLIAENELEVIALRI